MNDRVRIRVTVECAHASATEEYEGPTKAEWAAMSEKDREVYLDEAAMTELANNGIGCGAEVVD